MTGSTATPLSDMPSYTVGELATLAGVSIRTLHHYDAIGLLSPSERTAAGYRVYRHEDLEDLQQILLYRELDMPLDAIGGLMVDPAFDRRAALVAQTCPARQPSEAPDRDPGRHRCRPGRTLEGRTNERDRDVRGLRRL